MINDTIDILDANIINLGIDFEIIANKILDEKSTKFTLQNKENLDALLKPLQEKIYRFEKRVEETNKESLGRHSELRQQIKGLAELNLQMSKDADNLTKALYFTPQDGTTQYRQCIVSALPITADTY